MADSLLRQWHILRMIPRAPHGITINQIIDNLRNHPLTVPDYRTIQRDLNALSCVFPLQSEKRGKANYWYMDMKNTILEIPEMEPATALAFCLAQQQLLAQMPPEAMEHLEAHFNTAAQLLDKHDTPYAQWREKIRVLPQTQPLIAPKIDKEVSNTIYVALLKNRRIKAKYVKRGEDMPTDYTLSPLGLVFRGTVTYLVCSMGDNRSPIYLPLQRFVDAEMTEQERSVPSGFDLDVYIRKGKLDYLLGDDDLELELLVDEQVAIHLSESKLSEDQQLTLLASGQSLFKATVRDTGQLRWWLRGFAEQIEVLKPESLRQEFKETIEKMKAKYSDNRK
ncbi:WYL domain-containing protein [Nitrosomonas sp.]|uniref:helix-turn-helix transcriptional regulator n=1 Tax=Nitrosomonas sp. TaxID=42353 RepID=UPI002609FE59|nr:WYL domain-containing protein [Nitrosomonas sp.]MCW5601397.1 WYL domain-containing protein [Nitrosomonas sp.]